MPIELTPEQRAAFMQAVFNRKGRAEEDEEAMFAAGIAYQRAADVKACRAVAESQRKLGREVAARHAGVCADRIERGE